MRALHPLPLSFLNLSITPSACPKYSGDDDRLDLTEEATKEAMVRIRRMRPHGPWYDNRFGGGLSTKLNGGLVDLLCFLIIFQRQACSIASFI